MFLNGLVQYNNVSDEWSANVRFNIIHRPLSDFLCRLQRPARRERRVKDRAVIVKYTYLFTF